SLRRPGDSGAVDEEREVEEECEVTKAPARGRGEERCRRWKRWWTGRVYRRPRGRGQGRRGICPWGEGGRPIGLQLALGAKEGSTARRADPRFCTGAGRSRPGPR